MITFNSRHAMRSVNKAIRGFEPEFTFTQIAGTRHLVLSGKESDHDGCYACRFRKKKCRHYPGRSCQDCARFNIICNGAGLERPTGKPLAEKVREKLKQWIADKNNRAKGHAPFDLAPFFETTSSPPPTKFCYVNPGATTTTTCVISQPMTNEPINHPAVVYGVPVVNESLFPMHNTEFLGVNNGQSSSVYPHATYGNPTHPEPYPSIPAISVNEQPLYSPTWVDLNPYSFEPPRAGSYPSSNGSSDWPHTPPDESYLSTLFNPVAPAPSYGHPDAHSCGGYR